MQDAALINQVHASAHSWWKRERCISTVYLLIVAAKDKMFAAVSITNCFTYLVTASIKALDYGDPDSSMHCNSRKQFLYLVVLRVFAVHLLSN